MRRSIDGLGRSVTWLRWSLPIAGVLVAVGLMSAPVGAEASATVAVGQSAIDHGTTTMITAGFISAAGDPATLTLKVAPQSGTSGRITLSNPETATDPPSPNAGEWSCALNATDDQVVECSWSGPGKAAGETATVAVTATATGDAAGQFLVTASNERADAEVVLDTKPITVSGVPATTNPPTTVRAATPAPPPKRALAPRNAPAATPARATTTTPPTSAGATTVPAPVTITSPATVAAPTPDTALTTDAAPLAATTTVPTTVPVPATVTLHTTDAAATPAGGSDGPHTGRAMLQLLVGIAAIAAGSILFATTRRGAPAGMR